MATPNAPKGGQKAARATRPGQRAARGYGDNEPKRFHADPAERAAAGRADADRWRKRGDELRIDAVAARDLEENLIPQLQDAGYDNDQIKAIYAANDPHLAAKALIQSEKDNITQQILALNVGYTPESLRGASLSSLKETLANPPTERPSNIRGKNPQASESVESRTPDTAADAEMDDAPGVPPVMPQPDKRKMSAERAAKMKAAAQTKANVERVGSTGSFDGVDWLGANRDPLVVGQEAKRSDWSNITADDMTGERGPVWKQVDPQRPADSTAQQAPPLEAVEQAADAPKGPSVLETEPLLYYPRKAASAAIEQAKKRPGTAAAAAVIGVPAATIVARYGGPIAYRGLEKLYGAAFGSGETQQPAPQQQQTSPGVSNRRPINILSPEALREVEGRRASPSRQMAPPPDMPPAQQPIQPPPQEPRPKPMQSTDIIRQLSNRMA